MEILFGFFIIFVLIFCLVYILYLSNKLNFEKQKIMELKVQLKNEEIKIKNIHSFYSNSKESSNILKTNYNYENVEELSNKEYLLDFTKKATEVGHDFCITKLGLGEPNSIDFVWIFYLAYKVGEDKAGLFRNSFGTPRHIVDKLLNNVFND